MNVDFVLGREIMKRLLPQWLTFHRSTMNVTLVLAFQLAQAEREQTSNLLKQSPILAEKYQRK